MITISLCMIVRDEEANLARCLESVRDLMDEIIIVDTGSTDATKEIAARYTDRIYDFEWISDFAAARNFAFSKATMDYIYSADADEVLDAENHERFRILKARLLPEIELVQMKYGNQLQYDTVYNFDEEYRPKLFRRLRTFVWMDPVHEQIRTEPVIYDSDVVITHKPHESHAGRDLKIFHRFAAEGYPFSKRLYRMYVTELYAAGAGSDFADADAFFREQSESEGRDGEEVRMANLVLLRGARLRGDDAEFMRIGFHLLADEPGSEACAELGGFYEEHGDPAEAAMWYYNAAFETVPIFRLAAAQEDAAEGLRRCYAAMGDPGTGEDFAAQIEAREVELGRTGRQQEGV